MIPPSPTHGGHLSPAFRGGLNKSSPCLPPGLVNINVSELGFTKKVGVKIELGIILLLNTDDIVISNIVEWN